MTGFTPGFASRHDAAAAVLGAAFALPKPFETFDLRGGSQPRNFAPQGEGGPRHFTPQDPDSDPTAGWDPLDPNASQPEAAGFVDPIAAAHAAGHAEGYAKALAEIAADTGRDRALADALGDAFGRAASFDRDAFARRLQQTVLTLVARIVGESGVSAELLTNRIEAAADCLADSAESALLRLNPEDVPLVEGRLPKTIFAVADPHMARGSFALESASTVVEDGPDEWLAQLAQAIDRVAMPPC